MNTGHQLYFRTDGTFRIVQFSDLHWRDGQEADQKTAALMSGILDEHKPDLAVITGDVIDGAVCRDPVAAWAAAMSPMIQRKTPWATVFGNHEDEGAADREELMEAQRRMPCCLAQRGPGQISGVGNYVLTVRSAHSPRAAAALYFFDSHGNAPAAIGGWAWIKQDQIAWYLEQSRRRAGGNGGQPLAALAFLHIPLPEFQQAWEGGGCVGRRDEPISFPKLNSGLFTAMHTTSDVKGVFAGHNHLCDFEGTLHGIRLCYGRCTGFAGYGRDGFPRGARLIEISEHRAQITTRLLE